MIDKAKIETIVKSYIRGTDMFLVNLKVTRDNKITIFVDTPTDITIEQCAELNRFIECNLSRDEEDYELQVSSPGIGHTFVVKEQYIKNLRNIIEVTHLNGEKFKGILKNVTDKGIELELTLKNKDKSKSGAGELKNISFNFDEIKSAREYFVFR